MGNDPLAFLEGSRHQGGVGLSGPLPEVAPIVPPATSTYDRLVAQFNREMTELRTLEAELQAMQVVATASTAPTLFALPLGASQEDIAAAQAAANAGTSSGVPSPSAERALLLAQIGAKEDVIFGTANRPGLRDRILDMNPVRAYTDLEGEFTLTEVRKKIAEQNPPARARLAPQLTIGHSTAAVFDPNTLTFTEVPLPEGFAAPPTLQTAVDRQGNLVAFDPTNPDFEPTVLMEGFNFAAIDPQIQFAENRRQFEAQLELQRFGAIQQTLQLDLQQRGQMITALSNDFANQIALGQMAYQEAQLNLNRISEALTQRRAERQAILDFAVTKASLRNVGGEMLTQLPFSDQLAGILSQATGQQFTPDQFRLPTTKINPEQAGQDVLNASQPPDILGPLAQSLQDTRESISSLFGPLGGQAVNQQATEQVVEGL